MKIKPFDDTYFMKQAIAQAKKAYDKDEVPVGAVVVKENIIIGRGRNTVIADNDVSSHAEINALRSASKELNNFRLNGCTIYVTLEPCHMCAKAIIDARLDKLVFAAKEPKTGSICSIDNFLENKLDTNWGTPASLAKLFTMACAGTGLALVERLGVPEGDYA